MRRKRIRAYLLDSKKLKKVFNSIVLIILLLSCAFFTVYTYCIKNQKHYVKYTEDGTLDFKVYLKNNDFFAENFIESNKEYVANLIDYINAEFKYNLKLDEENIKYDYAYKVEARVDITSKSTNNSLYDFSEDITPEEIKEPSEKEISLDKFVKIDYNKYNQIAKSFITLYELNNVNAVLTVNFYVDINGNCDTLEQNVNNENIYSLCIPLNENTIDIDITEDVKSDEDKIIACKQEETHSYWLLAIAAVCTLIAINLTCALIKYIHKYRTAESIYERELRKILNNYGSYIQKVNNGFNLKDSIVLEVDTFNDLLEIRETIQEPIIMLESENKQETYFMIMGKKNIVYIYYIKVSDIKLKKYRRKD